MNIMTCKIGFCITGSFCSMDDMLYVLKKLCKEYDVEVFMTPNVFEMDTRFYKSDELKVKIMDMTKKDIHHTINESEIYGPDCILDVVVVYPCDANTLNKLDNGV